MDLNAQAAALVATHGSIREASRSSGINFSTLQSRYHKGIAAKNAASVSYTENDLQFPDLPSSELPPDQLIEQACARFEGHKVARDARRWMEIKVKSNQPIGVCFMGDPHVDNNGCNWPLLRRDLALLKDTPGLYAV